MFNSKLLLIACVSLSILSACSTAQKSSEVKGVRLSVAPYLKMSCKELATEQNKLVRDAESVGGQVDAAYDSDKGAELVAWIIFAPAAFFLEGNAEQASELASIKGQLDAVIDAQKINECTSG